MSGLFSKPKSPKVPEVTTEPEKAKADANKEFRPKKRETILTGALGDTTEATTNKRKLKTLLGE